MADFGTMFGSGGGDTFFGLPACDDLARLDAHVAVMGAPAATPYTTVGPYCADAPAAMRAAVAGYASSLGHHDFDLEGPLLAGGGRARDLGDVPWDAGDAAGNRERIRDRVAAVLDRGAVPVVMGGDDSVPIPVLEAYAGRGPLTVLQVDAHIDWRDEVDGERLGLSSTMRRASEMDHVAGIIQVGARAVGSARPGDLADAEAWGARIVRAREVHAAGLDPAIAMVPEGGRVFLTIDVDGLDPAEVPAVIGPSPGGLRFHQVLELMHGVAARATIVGADVVELMPAADVGGRGALAAARLVANAVGLAVRQRL